MNRDNIIAFLFGDGLATLLFMIFKDHIPMELMYDYTLGAVLTAEVVKKIALQFFIVIIGGVLGGFFGLLGKDIYKSFKKNYFQKKKNDND